MAAPVISCDLASPILTSTPEVRSAALLDERRVVEC
jgi:hypothetical protein